MTVIITLSPRDYDAVLFDLDGGADQDGQRACLGLEHHQEMTEASSDAGPNVQLS